MSRCSLMPKFHCRRGQAAFGVRTSGFDTCCWYLVFLWLSCPWTRQLYRTGLQLSECHVTVICIYAPYIRSLHAAENIPGLSKVAAFRCGIVETFILLGCLADSLVFGYRRFGTIYPSQLRRPSVIPSLFLSILFHFLSFFLSLLFSTFCFFSRFLLLYSPSL